MRPNKKKDEKKAEITCLKILELIQSPIVSHCISVKTKLDWFLKNQVIQDEQETTRTILQGLFYHLILPEEEW